MEGSEDTHLHVLELESSNHGNNVSNHQFHATSALEILRESVRILRYNCSAFMLIAAMLICPVSVLILSKVLVDPSIVKKLAVRLLLVAKASGLQVRPFIKQLIHKISEMVVSSTMCIPMFITLALLSKVGVAYSVDCTYSKKEVDVCKFFGVICKIWRRPVKTYLWVCMVIFGCLTTFFVLLVAVCSSLSVVGFTSDLIGCVALIVGLVFSVVFAIAIIICNTGIVVSVLENVSGAQALLKSGYLIKGQTQVGLVIFLGSTIGMAFIEWLFEHRVITLSYGDGSSRLWEGPLLVIMYSFVVLIDSMMNAIFYFSCKFYSTEASIAECQSILNIEAISDGPTGNKY